MCPEKNITEGATPSRKDPFRLSGHMSRLQLLWAAAIWLLASTCSLADTVVLTGGDIIEGVITKQNRSAVVLEHCDLGRLEIPRERINSLRIESPEFKKEEKVGWFDPKLREFSAKTSRLKEKGWKASADLSLNSSTGNTDERTMRIGSHAERALPDRSGAMDLSFYHKVKEGEVSDNKVTIGGVRDWLYPGSVWFCFLHGRYDYDQFESWRQRANAQVGPGYHLIESDDVTLDVRCGLGPRREWGSQNTDLKLEGLVGAEFEWEIIKKHTFELSPYFFSVVDDLGDYRARITGEWRFLFDSDSDMNLNFLIGTLYEYQSMVDAGKAHGDLRTYLGLRFGF